MRSAPIIVNPRIAACVINDGAALRSLHQAPVLRTISMPFVGALSGEASGLRLAERVAQACGRSLIFISYHRPHVEDIGSQQGSLGSAAHLLCGRGAARAASCNPRGRAGSLRHAILRQPQEIRAAADRHVPRAADRARQVDLQVRLDPRHGRVLRHQPVPGRKQRHHRRPRQPAGADRQHQEGAGIWQRARSAPITSSSSPTARRRRTRWPCRRCWRPATSRSSTATATSRTTTEWCWRRAAALRRSVPDDGILDVWRGAAAHHQAGAAEPEGRRQAATAPRWST